MISYIYGKLLPDPEIGKNNEAVRRAWIESALAQVPARSRILDAGAGELANKEFCRHLDYVSQDFCEYQGSGDGKGLQMGMWETNKIDIKSDIANIPEKNASFDAVICTEVLEHVTDPIAALKEFYRLLKSGGSLIITAPFGSLTHFSPYHYVSGFNRYFYLYHLEKLGFENILIEPNGNYFEFIAQEVRRLGSMGERYAEHKMTKKDNFAIKIMLQLLQRMSKRDTGSDELACFGFGVTALKR